MQMAAGKPPPQATAVYTYDGPTGIANIEVIPGPVLGTYPHSEKGEALYAEHLEELRQQL
jgi:hypothetical protein